MTFIKYILALFFCSAFAQTPITLKFLKKETLKTNQLVSINKFDTKYFISNNEFVLQNKQKNIGYSNIQLGSITSANTFNPLKINLFYKDFNTAIILDNRLAEIYKINFNSIQPYKSVAHISAGHDNTLWLFNQDTQELELYDYKINITRARTLPISSSILDMTSNYNYCWVLTKAYLYVYDYFGGLQTKTKNEGYTSMVETNENLILKKENALFYLKKNTETIAPISMPNLLIKQFFVTDETLYIYDDEFLYHYQLLTK